MEASCNFLSSESDKHRKELEHNKTEMKKMKLSCTNIEQSQNNFQADKERLCSRITDLEFRSMRENLIFYGIPETTGPENCDDLVKQLIQTKLQIDTSDIIFDRVHRMGSNSAPKPRPIVGKFHYFSDRENVRNQSYDDTIKKVLKDAGLGIGIQRPEQMREARKALYPIMKSEENKNNSVKLVSNKLFVNNKLYKIYVDGTVCDPLPRDVRK